MLYLYDSTGSHIHTMDEITGVTIGRGTENSLILGDSSVSRNHAKIINQNGQYLLQDLGSTNGTYVNNQKITSNILKDNGNFRCGNVTLYIRIVASDFASINKEPLTESESSTLEHPQKEATGSSLKKLFTFMLTISIFIVAYMFVKPQIQTIKEHLNNIYKPEIVKEKAPASNSQVEYNNTKPESRYHQPSSTENENPGNNANENNTENNNGNALQNSVEFGKNTYDIVKEGYKMQNDPIGTANRLITDENYADDLQKKVDATANSAEKVNNDFNKASNTANEYLDKSKKTLDKLLKK